MFSRIDIPKLKSERNVKGLIRALKSHSAEKRRLAASALGDLREAIAVDSLIHALNDKDWNVRCTVAETLGKIGDPRATMPLAIANIEYNDWRMPIVTEEALIMIGSLNVEPFINILTDKNRSLRQAAARILGKTGNNKAVDPLTVALSNDKDVLVRVWSAISLGKLGDIRAVEPLINALNDKEPAGMWGQVCEHALASLGNLRDERAVEPLLYFLSDDWAYWRKESAIALGKIGNSKAVDSLIVALSDEFAEVRIAATDALMSIGDHKGLLAAKARIRSLEQTVDELCVILDKEKGLDHPREDSVNEAKELGKNLNTQGGFELMKRVMEIVIQKRPFDYQRLCYWWDGIGMWRY